MVIIKKGKKKNRNKKVKDDYNKDKIRFRIKTWFS